jgi:putative oxidoreductase
MEIGLALLRLTTGLILAAHGTQKLFGWFGGSGLDVTGQLFETMGFLPGRRHALMAGLAETGGGALLALGLFTPIGAALTCSVMLVAVSVHVKNGFFAQNRLRALPAQELLLPLEHCPLVGERASGDQLPSGLDSRSSSRGRCGHLPVACW